MSRPVILLVGCEISLDTTDGDSFRVIGATTSLEALHHLDHEVVSVLVLGPRIHPEEMLALVEHSIAEDESASRANILSGVGANTEVFQSLVDQDRIFYLSRAPLRNADLRALILAGTRSSVRQEQGSGLLTSEMTDYSLEFCARICLQTDSATAATLLAETVREELRADVTQCFLCDRASANQVLTSLDTEPRVETAAAGISGYVTRTGVPVRFDRAGDDPRYDAESDNPGGDPNARFLAEPIFARPGVIIGVITATRSGTAEPFSPEEAQRAAALAGWAAPSLTALLMRESAEARMLDRARSVRPNLEIFRQEALKSHVGSGHEEGDVVDAGPAWLRRTHWVSITLFVISVIYVTLATVDETATGPAVVRARSKSAVASPTAGLVLSVKVAKGDHIRSGDLLVQLEASRTGLKSIQRELRAANDGLISDVRVRSGQQINPGDHVASIIDESAGYELITAIPKPYRPEIQVGMSVVFKLTGHPDSRGIVTIDRIGTETHRENIEAIGFVEPAVTVYSTLPRQFTAGGRAYPFEDGMTAHVEVRVRSEPLIINVVPSLRHLLAIRK